MVIDLLYLLTLGLGVYKGFRKGLIVALFSVLALMVGLAAAFKCSALTGRYIREHFSVPGPILPTLSFLVTFLVAALLVRLIARLIEKSVQLVLLGWVNRLCGVVLYAALYTTIFSFVLFFAEKSKLLKSSTTERSHTASFVRPWAPKTMELLGGVLPFLKGSYKELENFFESLSNGREDSGSRI